MNLDTRPIIVTWREAGEGLGNFKGFIGDDVDDVLDFIKPLLKRGCPVEIRRYVQAENKSPG